MWSSWSYHAAVHIEEEQSRSYRVIRTYSVNLGLKGHPSIYFGTNFISVRNTGLGSAGPKDNGRVYTMTSIAGPSGTMGQHEPQLHTSIV